MGMQALVGGITSIAGGTEFGRGREQASTAAQNAANAKQSEVNTQYDRGMNQSNTATVAGLLNYDKALQAQDRNISRQEQMLSQIDPTIMAASQQALRLLKGESASTLGPMQQQRDMQRQKLVDSLRSQLGPGAETSSMGMQALSRFDMETNQLTSSAQQQALGTVGQIFGQFNQGAMGQNQGLQSGIGQYAQMGQGRANLGFQQAGFQQGLGQMKIGSAGSQYTYDALMGQGKMQGGAALMGMGGASFGAGMASFGKNSGTSSFGSGGGSGGQAQYSQNGDEGTSQ